MVEVIFMVEPTLVEHFSWQSTPHGISLVMAHLAGHTSWQSEHCSWQSTPHGRALLIRRGRVSFTFKRARICLRHGRVRKKQFGRHPMCGNRICLRRAGIAGNGQNTARYYTVKRVQKKQFGSHRKPGSSKLVEWQKQFTTV